MYEYVIVQAGGKGTRMGRHTHNKPKALVSFDGLPMLFHLFRAMSGKKFIIIADYKAEVLQNYLQAFCKEKYIVVDCDGKKGTCAGLQSATQYIPSRTPFLLVWSDLIFPAQFEIPAFDNDFIGLSQSFPCRWQYVDGTFEEVSSNTHGIAGFFGFTDKKKLANVPIEGELVRWMSNSGKMFEPFYLSNIKEIGLIEEYEKLEPVRCRPFNRIVEKDGSLMKEGIDEQGQRLAVREKAWYRAAQKNNVTAIPHITNFKPLTMEKIDGKNVFEYTLTYDEKKAILEKIINALSSLHEIKSINPDYISIKDAYIDKTFQRINTIRDLVPHANSPYITINNRKCRNIFFHKELLTNFFKNYRINDFRFIHGDNTFSNIMLRGGIEPVLIDPRGYFGHTELYGDAAYDWAKLYYSIVGDYDQFNLKRFTLDISDEVTLDIQSNGWKDMENDFFHLLRDKVEIKAIKMIHAVIWLSLSTYAWDNYDSVCGAFYNGLYYLEEVLEGTVQ